MLKLKIRNIMNRFYCGRVNLAQKLQIIVKSPILFQHTFQSEVTKIKQLDKYAMYSLICN